MFANEIKLMLKSHIKQSEKIKQKGAKFLGMMIKKKTHLNEQHNSEMLRSSKPLLIS